MSGTSIGFSNPDTKITNFDIPQIEIYPNRMLFSFIEKGYIDTSKEDSKYIVISSYINRLEKSCSLLPEHKRLLLSFSNFENSNRNNLFSPEIAQSIYQFIEDGVRSSRIYVCCDDGQGRSNGIACALYRYYGCSAMENIIWKSPYTRPNLLVYQLVARAFRIAISTEELLKLRDIRDQAFENSLKRQTRINRAIYRYGLNSRVSMDKKISYFSGLCANDRNSDIHWEKHDDNVCELSLGSGDYEMMMFCMEIAYNSLEFVWYYGLKAEDLSF